MVSKVHTVTLSKKPCHTCHAVTPCLFLYKVDSLRAWFNLKYVYVLKSLTMTSKKIDCLS